MQTRAKRVAMLLAGWGFILLGVVGLFLPILQGVLFLIVGLLILSSEYAWAHHLVQKIRARFPELSRLDNAAAIAHKWTGKLFHHTPPATPGRTMKT